MGNRKSIRCAVEIEDVSNIELGCVYWTHQQIDNQYRKSWFSTVVTWSCLSDSEHQYWMEVVGVPPSNAVPFLPAWICTHVLVEKGIDAGDGKDLRFGPPPGHVLFAAKMAAARQRGFVVPQE